MKRTIQEQVVLRNVILCIIGVAVLLTLHFSGISIEWEWVIGILLAAALAVVGIQLEQTLLPREFRSLRLRKEMTAAVAVARESKGLSLVLHQLISELHAELAELRRGHFKDSRGTVPRLSVEVARAIKAQAVAVFIMDRSESYKAGVGLEYLKAWYARAEMIGPNRLHRLFVIESYSEVSLECVRLVEEHLQHGVSVSVIERFAAERTSQSKGLNLDFGLFDEECLMLVKTAEGAPGVLSVYVRLDSPTNDETIGNYSALWVELLENKNAVGGYVFLRDYYRPHNARFWRTKLTLHSPTLGPPHGLSDIDAKHMLDVVLKRHHDGNPVSVCILGFTTRLVEACIAEPRIANVVIIDQADVRPEMLYSNKISRQTGNWLTLSYPNQHFDAILGDEALNNLRPEQYRRFFQNMRSLLKPSGILVLRTMGRFDGTEQFVQALPENLLKEVKISKRQLSQMDDAVTVITYLHSANISFDPKAQLISVEKYNSLLHQWLKEGHITDEQADRFWFPDKENYHLELSSVRPDQICDDCRDSFEPSTFEAVDASYCGRHGELGHFYRIMPFTARQTINSRSLDLSGG